MKNQEEKERISKAIEAREILWALFIDEHDPRLSDAIKACNRFIQGKE